MKHFLLFILFFGGLLSISTAKEVKPETAKNVAQNLYQQISISKSSVNLELAYTSISKGVSNLNKSDSNYIPLFYVFNVDDANGFVIVSGDDNAIPILGYSTKGNFDNSNLPTNFRKWIEGYKNQIRHIITNNVRASEEIKSEWEALENGLAFKNNEANTAVNPLLTTTWSQSPYVNDLCPYDEDAGSANGYHCVSGCPATAMAQIMKYWNYPANGAGFHSYNHDTYGTLSANFASTTYDWGAMPNNVTSSNNAVATLMYHCGVAVEMGYGPTSSGSYVIIAASPTPQQCSEYAYKTYFGYNPSTLKGLIRDNYSDDDWIQLLKADLDLGQPIQYAGFGAGGHTFVCDGYDNNDYFHMNWGWGGYADGYFLIDALNPGAGGTGSGAGTYNDGQQAVFGIQPLSEGGGGAITPSDISLYDDVVATPNSISYGQGFTVHTDIANFGTTSFTGDFCAAIFDENLSFIEFVEILSDYTLGSQYYIDDLYFTNTGTLAFLPGSYVVGIFYRPTGGDWVMVAEGSYSNMIPFEVYYGNDIELFQDMIVSCGTNIVQNQAFTVTLDILNDGSTTFDGQFDVTLFNLDGSFAETIQSRTGSLDAGYYFDDVEFVSEGVSVLPGTYLMALLHLEDGGSWELTGSSYYSNPIFVTVQEEEIPPDFYEDNNTQIDAYNISVNFSNDNASVETIGSNLHIGTDDDFYKIDLASGFDYTITARVHDSYNSENGQTYTCDVAWLYLNGSVWSDSYDDVMPSSIEVNNGGPLYFRVAPYFIGQTGTYLLDLDIFRSPGIGIEDVADFNYLSVFPNPATDMINIKVENNINVNKVEIIDVFGKLVLQLDSPALNSTHIAFPIEELPFGTYMMLIQTEETTWQHKFIKSE